MKTIKNTFLLYLLVAYFICCGQNPPKSIVTPAHLNSLYETIHVQQAEMGIIHIYSEYPEYKWVWEKHEGIACVDDAARAAVFYLWYHQRENDLTSLDNTINLLRFIMFMQAENGYFYNFITEDLLINKKYHRSDANGDWWSWRALWALTESVEYFRYNDPPFADKISVAIDRCTQAVLKNRRLKKALVNNSGFEQPDWLPGNTAADQAAVLSLALNNYFQIKRDTTILNYIDELCDGMVRMQVGDKNQFPHGALLSWQNTWHGWGNIQSYALLKCAVTLNKTRYSDAALMEIEGFYEFLISNNFYSDFKLRRDSTQIITMKISMFPQIAYIIRPMVFACLEAYQQTRNVLYAEKAGKIAAWFFGLNPAGVVMYDAETGRCFDGLNETVVNKNSGAESTIEALLSLLLIEQNSVALNTLHKYIQSRR